MTIDDKLHKKLQYKERSREAAKMSALSPRKINKYEYLTGEEILPSNRRKIRERARLAFSPLGKALEKHTEEQVGA